MLSERCFAVVDVKNTGLWPRIELVIELGISVHRETAKAGGCPTATPALC
jgi:hypothetical protein